NDQNKKNSNGNIIKNLIFFDINYKYENQDNDSLLILLAKNKIDELFKAITSNKIIRNKQAIFEFLKKPEILKELTELLVSNININKQNKQGNTALTYAIINNNFELIKLLIKNKAKIKNSNTENKNAFDIARDHKRKNIFIYLILSCFDAKK